MKHYFVKYSKCTPGIKMRKIAIFREGTKDTEKLKTIP